MIASGRLEQSAYRWQIRLFKSVEAYRGETSISHFQTTKTALLLAYLAMADNTQVSRENLIVLLWPDSSMETGRSRLSQALSWLRRFLEENTQPGTVLHTERNSAGLVPANVIVDALEFKTLAQKIVNASLSRSPDNRIAVPEATLIERAITLYGGEFLPGFYDDWVLTERRYLQNLYLKLLDLAIKQNGQLGNTERELLFARKAANTDPQDELLQIRLMEILIQHNQPEEALQHFNDWAQFLARTLGDKPSAMAQTLARQCRSMLVSASSIHLPSSPAPSGIDNIPRPITRFFGRAEILHTIAHRLQTEKVRLITLTGLGGSGKTRLALEATSRLAPHFGQRVWYAPLADVREGEQIPDALLHTLQTHKQSMTGSAEQIVSALGGDPCLLVLDNAEHLLPALCPIVQTLLNRLPALVILVTSRKRLGLQGEQELQIPTLTTPEITDLPKLSIEALLQDESVGLFVDRAKSVSASFQLTERNAADMVVLCNLLEGIPLAIELCASWTQTLSLSEIVVFMRNRFDFLVSNGSDLPQRHQTLQAAIASSYDRLTPSSQQLLARLSVFQGGWTLEAAKEVCTVGVAGEMLATADGLSDLETLRGLTELRESSLIVAEIRTEEATRYQMLETVREFASTKLPPTMLRRLQERHACYYKSLSDNFDRSQLHKYIPSLKRERSNMEMAMHFFADNRRTVEGLEFVANLTDVWHIAGETLSPFE